MAIQIHKKNLYQKKRTVTSLMFENEAECSECGEKLTGKDWIYFYNGFSYTAKMCHNCHIIMQL